jgi:hypothetical protein
MEDLELDGWEDKGDFDIEMDVVMTWAECVLSMPGMAVEDLDLAKKYKDELRERGYE